MNNHILHVHIDPLVFGTGKSYRPAWGVEFKRTNTILSSFSQISNNFVCNNMEAILILYKSSILLTFITEAILP